MRTKPAPTGLRRHEITKWCLKEISVSTLWAQEVAMSLKGCHGTILDADICSGHRTKSAICPATVGLPDLLSFVTAFRNKRTVDLSQTYGFEERSDVLVHPGIWGQTLSQPRSRERERNHGSTELNQHIRYHKTPNSSLWNKLWESMSCPV